MHHSRAVYVQNRSWGPRALRLLAVGLIAALLGVTAPGPALAQSAGDQQYADPLGGSGGDQGGGQADPPESDGQGSGSGSGTTGSGTPPADQGTTAPETDTTPAAPSTQGGEQLARTGYPSWLAALAGGVLLASGATLRVSLGLRR